MIIKWAIFLLNQDTLKTYAKNKKKESVQKSPQDVSKNYLV
jgi:hypothetical protein